jgi:anti-sigma factor RsiW
MTCRELVGFLGAYLDGDLAADTRAHFAEHLAECPECAAYLETYRATVRLARNAFQDPDAPVPPEVPDDLVRAILAARRKGE